MLVTDIMIIVKNSKNTKIKEEMTIIMDVKMVMDADMIEINF